MGGEVMEFLSELSLAVFVVGNLLLAVLFPVACGLRQYYIRKLCKYRGTKIKPGAGCVTCAYCHRCSRAKKSEEYQLYAYFARVLSHRAKEMYDKIWEAEQAGKKEMK